jgi:hypothetical protein
VCIVSLPPAACSLATSAAVTAAAEAGERSARSATPSASLLLQCSTLPSSPNTPAFCDLSLLRYLLSRSLSQRKPRGRSGRSILSTECIHDRICSLRCVHALYVHTCLVFESSQNPFADCVGSLVWLPSLHFFLGGEGQGGSSTRWFIDEPIIRLLVFFVILPLFGGGGTPWFWQHCGGAVIISRGSIDNGS